ncbi:LysR family transcriptional regulator [Mesorhizobium sp. NZP2298]|uniref:LysR family transcriptional regulator n=1 Tax=Mesorhizobium sp. NZP2298 TaxID=2483403 RepID=UPI0015578269|nr:LysR family transcriptional regulator [Mesorhizobium sp. NZP2298]QKC94263.1 LysR family transcriptional regulator [Mesorhizobium sp. NZP2298]
MKRSHLPLNGLRAFEAAARHLSFTGAGLELRVTQAAISHQVKGLEEVLGVRLFRRLPHGLTLSDEGEALLPVLSDAFNRISITLDRFEGGRFHDIVTVGVVGTFASGWLIPRLALFHQAYPDIELRISTNNNRVNLAADGLDFAIRFGDGSWQGTDNTPLMSGSFSPACAPDIAARLRDPSDLARETLLCSYREDEWLRWFEAAGRHCPPIKGIVFDSSVTMANAAVQGAGVALLPVSMFSREFGCGQLVQPFGSTVDVGRYWLSARRRRQNSQAMTTFADWLTAQTLRSADALAAVDHQRLAGHEG